MGTLRIKGKFDHVNVKVDLWPDVSEYEKTYETKFKLADGSFARVFSSYDRITVDLHFKWMKNLQNRWCFYAAVLWCYPYS